MKIFFLVNALLFVNASYAYDVYDCFQKSEAEAKKELSGKLLNGEKLKDAAVTNVKMDMKNSKVPKIHLTITGQFGEGLGDKNFKDFDFVVEDAVTCAKPKLQEKGTNQNKEQASCDEQLQYLQDKSPGVYNLLKRELKDFHGVVDKTKDAIKESSAIQK